MATLSRDTDNANGKVSDGFEQGKIADRLEIQREAVALSVQTMGAVQSRLKADKENEIAAKLSAQGLTSEQIAASPEYKQVGQDYGIGGKYWTAGVSFTSALSGLLGGNIQGAAAGAAAPYLANLVKQISSGDEPLRIMLHTALGAFLASAQGGDAAAGAAGGLTSAGTADLFIKMFYPTVKEGELTEAQKQVIDNLVVIAGSTAGGLASGSLSGVGSGANTAKNEVENNYLSDKDIKTFTEKYAAAKTDAEKEQLVTDLKKLDADQQKQALSTGISIADQKTELEKLKQLAASPDCTGQCRELANYSISQLEPVVNNTQLHKDNLTKAVLASTIIALTLEQSGKAGEKAPATGTTCAGKSTSAIDDIVKGEGQAANVAKNTSSNTGSKLNAGKFGQLDLDILSQTGSTVDPAVKAGNLTVAGRALQKHGSREGSAFPIAKGTPAQMNEQGQKILDGIVKTPGATVNEGNRFGGFDVVAPDGRGARFDPQGNFRGFLEP